MGIEASYASIIIENSSSVEIYNETIVFECVENEPEDAVKTDLPEAIGGKLTIAVTRHEGQAKIGEIVIGNKYNLGDMRYAPEVGILDYSIKSTDDFGNYIIVERAYSKTLSCDLRILNEYLDAVYNKLVEYRATALVWIGSEDYDSLIIYGFCKNFEMVIPYITFTDCTLQIEGLT